MIMQPLSFFQQRFSNEWTLNSLTWLNISAIVQKVVLDVDLEYPKELRELHNGYTLAPEKIEIKREMFA